MKKITFLVVCLIVCLNATLGFSMDNKRKNNPRRYAIDYRNAEPILFIERGVEFMVFPTGDFDFNTSTVSNYSRPRTGYSYTTNYPRPSHYSEPVGVRVEHDYNGRIRRIGNVFISYDYYGRVRRIGSIYMSYNSFALTRIGNLRLIYNYHGEIIGTTGYINPINNNYYYNPCPSNYYYNETNDLPYDWNNDDDFYFYKKDGSKEKMKKEDIETIKKEAEELKK